MSDWKGAFDPIRAGEELKEKTRQRALAGDVAGGISVAGTDRRSKIVRRRAWAAAAAVLLAVALAAGGFRHYTITAEAAYVSVEAEGSPAGEREEPLFGLSVNRFGHVIRAEGLNEAGQEVLLRTDPVGKSYEEALGEIFSEATALGYLTEESQVDFGVCAGSESELVRSLQAESQDVVEAVCPSVSSGCGWVSSQTRAAAASAGMSCNRYQVAEAIMALDGTIAPEDCGSYSLCQLKCWYQALLDGRTVAPEEVPDLCEEYGYGGGCGRGCPAGDAEESGGAYGHGHGNGGGNGQRGHGHRYGHR